MKKVILLNKHRDAIPRDAVYIGRGTILGNPFSHIESSFKGITKVASRKEACEEYHKLFHSIIEGKNDIRKVTVMNLLDSLAERLDAEGELHLCCYCAPNQCHGETIATYLEDRVNGKPLFKEL